MAYFEIDTTVSIEDSDILDALHSDGGALEFAKDVADQLDADDLDTLYLYVKDLLNSL